MVRDDGDEDQPWDVILAGVPCALEAIDDHCVDPRGLCLERLFDARRLMDDLDAGVLVVAGVLRRVGAGCLDDAMPASIAALRYSS